MPAIERWLLRLDGRFLQRTGVLDRAGRAPRAVLEYLEAVYFGCFLVVPGGVLALQWTGGNRTYAVPYGTEAGIFRAAGVPTVVCGPGDIAQAHQPNEFILKPQITACEDFMRRMVEWACHT